MTVIPDIGRRFFIAPMTDGDIQAVQALHRTAWIEIAGPHHTERQNRAHLMLIDSSEYAGALLSNNLQLARSADGALLGSAGWCAHAARNAVARIRKVFVHPKYSGCGLGRALVLAAEVGAQQAGYSSFFVRANANAEQFYKRLSYISIERGEMDACGTALPVVFMEKPEPRGT